MDIYASKIDKETIYNIYRACRLCGAGAGYKMPIIQNVVDFDSNGIELKQKIRDCVQIEVNSDDKMPPLICELCVDKVNDFYDFMEMCQQTNRRTRARLGLPQQTTGKDSGDCILGVTEQVYGNEDSDEPLSSSRKPRPEAKVKIKVEKTEKENSRDSKLRSEKDRSRTDKESRLRSENNRESRLRTENNRESRFRAENIRGQSRLSRDSSSRSRSTSPVSRVTRNKRQSSPPRQTRHARAANEENVSLSSLKSRRDSSSRSRSPPSLSRATRLKRPPTPPRRTRLAKDCQDERIPFSSVKQQVKKSAPSVHLPAPKSILKKVAKSDELNKSKRTRDPPSKPDVPQKKVKLAAPPKCTKPILPPSPHSCSVCAKEYNTGQALGNHMRSHTVTYTNIKLTCNPCQLWFQSAEETTYHHRTHKNRRNPYKCMRCNIKFTQLQGYDDHIEKGDCLPWVEVPDVKCDVCWSLFPTRFLLDHHKCGGTDSRRGGKCFKCKRSYTLLKNQLKHEETCTYKRKSAGELVVDPEVMERIRPAQVRLVKCDAVLNAGDDGKYDISQLQRGFGLDPWCYYPYRRTMAPMVTIKADLDLSELADDEGDLVHWDSSCSDEETTVNSLSTLALKTIFSEKLLGKVPRKRRRIKTETNDFDAMNPAFDDFNMNLDNIIDNLANDDNASVNSESLFSGNREDFTNLNDNNGSQSLLLDVNVKNTGVGSNNEEWNKDNISTDCETEADDNDKAFSNESNAGDERGRKNESNDFSSFSDVETRGNEFSKIGNETSKDGSEGEGGTGNDLSSFSDVETRGNEFSKTGNETSKDGSEGEVGTGNVDCSELIMDSDNKSLDALDLNIRNDQSNINDENTLNKDNDNTIITDKSDDKTMENNDIRRNNENTEDIAENGSIENNDILTTNNSDERLNNERTGKSYDIEMTNVSDENIAKEQTTGNNNEINDAEQAKDGRSEVKGLTNENKDNDSKETTIQIDKEGNGTNEIIAFNDNQTACQENNENDINNHDEKIQEVNRAICKDIESKINDLIALRNENNDSIEDGIESNQNVGKNNDYTETDCVGANVGNDAASSKNNECMIDSGIENENNVSVSKNKQYIVDSGNTNNDWPAVNSVDRRENNDSTNKNNEWTVNNEGSNENDDWPTFPTEHNAFGNENNDSISKSNEWTVNSAYGNENNDSVVKNNEWTSGSVCGNENNDVSENCKRDFMQNNEKDKISLEDLLPHKDSDLKSMDLDSISDEEFNFDT